MLMSGRRGVIRSSTVRETGRLSRKVVGPSGPPAHQGPRQGPAEVIPNPTRSNKESSAAGCPSGFWRGSVLLPEGLPLGAVGQGPPFHKRPDVLRLPARPGLLQPQVQQLLDRPLHQAAAGRL